MPNTHPSAAYFSARDKQTAQRWSRCQPGAPRLPGAAAAGKAFSLDSLDPGDKPFATGSKTEDKAAVEALAVELNGFQIQFEDAPTGAFGADGEEEIAQSAVLEFIAGG